MNLKFFVSSNCEALRGVMQSPLKVYHNSPRVSIQDDAVLSAESITELSTSSLRSRHRPNHRESQHSRSMSEIREEKRSFFHLAVEKNTSKKKIRSRNCNLFQEPLVASCSCKKKNTVKKPPTHFAPCAISVAPDVYRWRLRSFKEVPEFLLFKVVQA